MNREDNNLLPARVVRTRFGGVSDMTLWRWLNDDRLGFPKPITLNRLRYWKAADIDRFIESRRLAS